MKRERNGQSEKERVRGMDKEGLEREREEG